MNGETSDRSVEVPTRTRVKLTTDAPVQGSRVRCRLRNRRRRRPCSPAAVPSRAGDVEEERRLFYVAVTRAKNELYICYPKVASRAGPGGMLLTPSRFITELEPRLYEPVRIKPKLRLVAHSAGSS